MWVKKVLFLFLLNSSLLLADATTISPSQSGGIIDLYFDNNQNLDSSTKVYITVTKVQKMVSAIMSYRPRSQQVFQCENNTCPLDKTECVNSTCPVGTWNSTLKKCVTTPTTADCLTPAVWNSTSKMCESGGTTTYGASSSYKQCCLSSTSGASYGCTTPGGVLGATLFDSQCAVLAVGNYYGSGCGGFAIGYSQQRYGPGSSYCRYNPLSPYPIPPGTVYYGIVGQVINASNSSYTCNTGDTLTGTTCTHVTLVQTNPACPINFTYVQTDGLCESDPQCPSGMLWNKTSGFCEATPICTAPAVWNGTSKKCESGGTTTYGATNSSVTVGGWIVHDVNNEMYGTSSAWGAVAYDGFDYFMVNLRCTSGILTQSAYIPSFDGYYMYCIGASYTCNPGDTLSGTTCTHSTLLQTAGICTKGALNQTAGRCQMAPGSIACPSGAYQCNTGSDGKQYCSVFGCVNNICGLAWCNTAQEALDGASDPAKCKAISCDLNLQYNPYCGSSSCAGGLGLYKGNDGNCYRDVCPTGSTEQIDGTCKQLSCPNGTHEVSGSCVNN